MAPSSSPEKPLSEVLAELCADPDQAISIAELVTAFGPRAFGAILLVFGAACALPLPPGSSTVLGAPLVLLAPQVAFGARAPWLPRALRNRQISATHLRQVFGKIVPTLRRIEKVSRPRLQLLFGSVGDRVIGVVCSILALVLILPIPLGNVLPAASVSFLSLALITRDGVLAIVGYVLAIASAGVLALAFGIVMGMVQKVLSIVAAAA